jgi:glucose-6-phosphate dehydrogenase assembly protein OpcA
MSATVIHAQPEMILKALGQVWTSLGEEERHQGKPTVLRACAMTLIVIAGEDDDQASSSTQTLTELMHSHPSRAIVLRTDDSAESGLSARVFAQCWKPFGKAQQICCEQIEVAASADRWADVAPTLLGIIVPDLPVVVWSRQPAVSQSSGVSSDAAVEAIFALASKIILDTENTPAKTAFDNIQRWKRRGHILGDLEWTRLTVWRETIANVFDDDAMRAERGHIHTVDIGYTGEFPPASALYLGGWLKRGISGNITFTQDEGNTPGLSRVTLKSDQLSIELGRSGPTCLRLRIDDHEQQVSRGGSSLYELMQEELTVLGPDAVFDAAFEQSGSLLRQ